MRVILIASGEKLHQEIVREIQVQAKWGKCDIKWPYIA